ncbi:hypothetical protein BKA70DRAFT_1536224 [Coprinopsis sp. MPI-PUGE-AT-0042]|nr:hypothetical protein BKA70DRAFT_1536224 [Coprinopsis sp. MPI-PUGE-AT-0042]
MIVFYDISSLLPHAWSPNTLKTRLCLAYKCLQHKPSGFEFPDIAAACKEKGFKATASWKDGTPYYSLLLLLTISEGSGETQASSYPRGKRRRSFKGTFHSLFESWCSSPSATYSSLCVATIFNPASKEHFSKGRAEPYFNTDSLDNVHVKSGEEEGKIWDEFRKGWDELESKYYAPTDDKGPWILGDPVSFADFVVVVVS